MPEQSCTDCRWLSEHGELHKWHSCEAKFVAPASVIRWDRESVDISRPFTNCPTWEKRALTREEQIEAAARAFVDGRNRIEPRHFDDLIQALALPNPPTRSAWDLREPAQPTEAEMRRAVMEAGWEVGTCCWWAPGNSAAARTLTEAYARVMRERAVVFAGESADN